MTLDIQAITKIAKLARLRIDDAEKPYYAEQLSGILKWMEQLNEVNTDGVPQMTSVADLVLPKRADLVTDGNQQEAVVKNAPQSDYGCFVVPKVME